jgi:hypothetical protein
MARDLEKRCLICYQLRLEIMLVNAMVRAVETGKSGEKEFAIISLETSQPLEIIQFRMFDNHIKDGTVAHIKSCIGADISLPLEAGIYQNKIQYQFPYGAVFNSSAAGSVKK